MAPFLHWKEVDVSTRAARKRTVDFELYAGRQIEPVISLAGSASRKRYSILRWYTTGYFPSEYLPLEDAKKKAEQEICEWFEQGQLIPK